MNDNDGDQWFIWVASWKNNQCLRFVQRVVRLPTNTPISVAGFKLMDCCLFYRKFIENTRPPTRPVYHVTAIIFSLLFSHWLTTGSGFTAVRLATVASRHHGRLVCCDKKQSQTGRGGHCKHVATLFILKRKLNSRKSSCYGGSWEQQDSEQRL